MTFATPEASARLLRRVEDSYYRMLCERMIWRALYDWFDYATILERDAIVGMANAGRRKGIINREEYIQALRSDIIARDDGIGDREGDLAVVESSTTLDETILHNAGNRAEIIRRITDTRTDALAVVFHSWSEELNELGQQLGVTVIQFRPQEFEDL